jgi:hypothetical protein
MTLSGSPLQMKIYPLVLVLMGFSIGCGLVTPPSNGPPPDVRPQEANVASLAPQNWYIYHSAGTPLNPSADIEGAWSFDFPSSEAGGHVNYVQTPFNATTVLHNVSITFKVESSAPQYDVLDSSDISPATIHLFIEQRGDDLVIANGRWWAQVSGYNLGSHDSETITSIVPLTPDQWSNVYGKNDAQAFYAALENIGWIGLTCGGQYFWGHGVAMDSGSAKFILIDFQVN